MRATAILCLCASALTLAACPGPPTDKGNDGAAAPEANQVVDVPNVAQTGNVSTPIASGTKCCTGPSLGDSCVAQPASGGCPADKPVLVSEP